MAEIQSTWKPARQGFDISDAKKDAIKETYAQLTDACQEADSEALELAQQTQQHMHDRYMR